MNRQRLAGIVLVGGLTLSALAGCASVATTDGPLILTPAPLSAPLPTGDVIGQGLVLDPADGDPVLCLGPVAESAPPQCSGIPLVGWSWDGVPGPTDTDGTVWGSYAVAGTYAGDSFTVMGEPILLALYDPAPLPDPTDGVAGTATDAELESIAEELIPRLGDQVLGSAVHDGWLWVDVIWDDGSIQSAVDKEYGSTAVAIRSALVPLG